MDYFGIFVDGLCLLGQAILHILFVSRLTGKKRKIWHFAVYLSLICVIEMLSFRFSAPGILAVCAEVLTLCGTAHFALKNNWAASWLAAIFAVYVSQLSFGIVNSAEIILFPRVVGKPLLYPLFVIATLLAFVICVLCYAVMLNYLSLTEDRQTPYAGILLLPGLFFFASELYILHTAYSFLDTSLSPGEVGKHGALLLLQVLGLGALLCTEYAYQRLCRSLQTQTELRSLSQAAQAQKTYIAEAQMRYEQTKAFRHDIKNHLSVLSSLLSSGKLEESKAYLQKLEAVSTALSLPCQTGNPVVDILLGEKLGLASASGITTEVSLLLPRPCVVDSLDLCIVFANALDNAISACQTGDGERFIHIRGERQGDFYMLIFENTCSDGPLPPAGTGLTNIKSTAEKYHGVMLAEKAGRTFSLSVLLNISLQAENSSGQTY